MIEEGMEKEMGEYELIHPIKCRKMTVSMPNSSTGNHKGTSPLGRGRDLPKPRNHSDSSDVQSVKIRILIFQRDPIICFLEESLTTSKNQPEEPHSSL